MKIEIRAPVTYGAFSIYDDEDIWGEGGRGTGGLGGCSAGVAIGGTGCNDLPGGSGEPAAVLGPDGDGRLDYKLSADVTQRSPSSWPLAGFHTRSDPGQLDGGRQGHGNRHRGCGSRSQVWADPGRKARFRYFTSFDEFVFDLIR